MTRRSLRSLLERPVRLNGIELGRAAGALVDVDTRRVVGFDVVCGDNTVRFLPLGAARIVPGALELDSALILLEEDDQGFYRKRGRPFRELVGTPVERGDARAGELRDLLIDEDGLIATVRVAGDGVERDVPVDEVVALGAASRESAA